jgi:hypothetical protein
MMVQDSITWTGARAPGVERRTSLRMAVIHRAGGPDAERATHAATGSTKGGGKLINATGMLGASLTEAGSGKALSDRPALEPHWGKPAVRNLRGDDGNGGIIRSPIRTTSYPPHDSRRRRAHKTKRVRTIAGIWGSRGWRRTPKHELADQKIIAVLGLDVEHKLNEAPAANLKRWCRCRCPRAPRPPALH